MCKKMCKNITLDDVKNSAFLADQAYKNFANGDKVTNPATGSSFEVVEQTNEDGGGFSGTLFKNTETNEYVIAFRGTELSDQKVDYVDIADDVIMLAANTGLLGDVTNKQFSQAFDFTNKQIAKILAKDPNAKISLTGHSLGGSLAQAVGAKSKLQTTTFNAYGIKGYAKNILSEDEINSAKDNVTNIYDSRDPISNGDLFGGEHVGRSIALDTGDNAISDSAGSPSLAAGSPGLAAGSGAGSAGLAESLAKEANKSKEGFNKLIEEANKLFDNLKEKHPIEKLIPELDKPSLNIDLCDPIALDLNNNGKIDTLTLENGVFFDHNGDEIAFKSSWISGGDGILARDINGDKEINSGAELFGNFTKLKNGELAKNGAEALKDLDDNNDGIFDSNDKAFNEILVWQDFNSNGKAESGELKSLSEHGIKSINL
ncbi:MAG: hypothetical protein MR469_03800, partial [Campylobacter sp.]|uniref:lipase family protein n=1 Tax=Campylobacter sp. TaxID=205 RepID=UPI002AA8DEB8